MKQLIRKNWSFILIGLFVIITLVFVLVKGEGIYIQVHDTLDNNIVWLKMLKDNHLFWEKKASVPFLGGADRNYLYSPLKAYVWLYMIFPTFPALIIGWYLKIAISICGFVFLAKTVCKDIGDNFNLTVIVGFLYGILPTVPASAFEFASLPFLLAFLILFYKKFKWKYLCFLFLYPVFSRFVVFGIFICGYLVIFFMIDWFAQKKPKWRMLVSMATLALGYILSEWRLFYMMLFSSEESLRSMEIIKYKSIPEAVKDSLQAFIYGVYHCEALHKYIVLPVCVIYFVYINYKYFRKHNVKGIFSERFNWIMMLIAFNSAVVGVSRLEAFRKLIHVLIPPLTGFNFSRTIWMNPFLWYFAFFLVLYKIPRQSIKYALCFGAFCIICFKGGTYNHLYLNLMPLVSETARKNAYNNLTYAEFYSVNLFEKIKEDIQYSGEWSIAFGMHPAVIEYNGIATLDGYLSYYSLDYKNQFRKLIEPELNMDESNAQYYDNWGGRAYVFSNEISFKPSRKTSTDTASLNIDPDVFRELGGTYIFSRVEVSNMSELGIEEMGVYRSGDSPYTIYVYRLK